VAVILLGILSGFSGIAILKSLGLFIADVFIKIFKCISLPIICLSIIVTLSKYKSESGMKTIWRRTMTYTFGTTLIAAAISCLLYLIIHPSLINNVSVVREAHSQIHYLDHISNLIPSSFFAPFIEQQVLSVLLLGIVIGTAIRFIPEESARQTITSFF
jgi:Na+/H+-dicarboxylate symporter